MKSFIANLRKEWISEVRSAHGVFTSAAFGFAACIAFALALYGQKLSPPVAAACLLVLFLFSAMLSVPRSFIAEDELQTLDLLRLVTAPDSAFAAKSLVHLALQCLTALATTALFCGLTEVVPARIDLLILAVLLTLFAAVSSLSLASMLVAGAQNRWVLAALAGLPLLIPTLVVAHPALHAALSSSPVRGAERAWLGLLGLGIASWGIGFASARANHVMHGRQTLASRHKTKNR